MSYNETLLSRETKIQIVRTVLSHCGNRLEL